MRVLFVFFLLVVALTGLFETGDCMSPLLSSSTLTASSQLSPMYSAAHAYLSSLTAWCPRKNFTDKEYLQVDFGAKKVVKQILTAGEASPAVNQTARRVTKYLTQVSADGVTYEDFEPIEMSNVTLNIRTQYMRIVPIEFDEFPCMRLEIYGCKAKNPELCSDNNGGCSQTCIQHSKYCIFGKCFFQCHIDFLCTYWVDCDCRTGYKLLADKKNCADVDECANNNGNCDHMCENSPGSYQCKCRSGFSLDADKHTCNDINECDTNKGGCNQFCRNTVGSYYCECSLGYKLSQDNHTCLDIDECLVNNGGCSDGCQNLQGTYFCTCPHGYEVDQTKKNCIDTNECLLANGGCETNCHNTNGSFYCSCANGFELYDQFRCRDIDECSSNTDMCNKASTNCRNFQGGYECVCKTGYKYIQGDDYNCEPISCPPLVEVQGTSVSPQECLVVDGRKVNDNCTFSCKEGYELPSQQDTLTCLDTGSWDALTISCRRIMCPALPALPNGSLLPSMCSVSGNLFDESCLYKCNSGYRLNGVATRKCLASGQWDVQAAPTCDKEYVQPWITCPSDVYVNLAADSDVYDITGQLQQPQSNVQNIQIYPENYRNQLIFPLGTTVLTYVASNEAGDTANCTTDIVVRDLHPPTIVYCPGNIYQMIAGTQEAVTWKEPEFSDNVKVESVTSTKKPGDIFQVDSPTTVKYDAVDQSGNTISCSFVVQLQQRKCKDPEDPDNAKLTCLDLVSYKYCSITCNPGKQLFKYTFGSTCLASTLVWVPEELPDCVDSVALPPSGQCPTLTIPQASLSQLAPQNICVKCPRGLKYDETSKDCVACPVGYISQQESSLTCSQCPPKTSTKKEGSKTCTDLCDKGESSADGFNSPQGCTLCNVGFYQDQYGATECKQCPNGYSTVAKGSTSMDDCGTIPTVSSFGPPSMVVDVDENGIAEFVCMAAGAPAPTFKLVKEIPVPDGFPSGQLKVEYIRSGNVVTGVRYTIENVTEYDAGKYSCSATNIFGSDSRDLNLNVNIGGSGAGQ